METFHMDDKRTALAVLLSILVVVVYTEVFLSPYTRPQAPEKATQSSAPVAATTAVPAATLASSTVSAPSIPATAAPRRHPNPAELENGGHVTITTPLIHTTISRLGARLSHLQLEHYKVALGSQDGLDMVTAAEGFPLPLAVITQGFADDFVAYKLASVSGSSSSPSDSIRVAAGEHVTLNFEGVMPHGVGITKSLTFNGDSYLIDVQVKLSVPSTDGSRMWLEWTQYEADPSAKEQRYDVKHYIVLSDNKVTTIAAKDVSENFQELVNARWLALSDRYFMSALFPALEGINARIGIERLPAGSEVLRSLAAGTSDSGTFRLYVGPKDYEILQQVGSELQRSIDLGWFTFLAHPLLALLRWFYRLTGNYGLAIVLLTLLIKSLFLPLAKAQFKSMSAMQELQPEINALKERIKDQTQLQQEIMGLYKKRGVNPMGGCLPVLIQIPVFIGLYNALLYSIELRHAPFALWINDLSAPERLELFGFGIPVMVLLLGATMFIQQLQTPSNMDPAQRKVMMFMPLVFTFLFLGFPSGLTLYWLVNTGISIIQQSAIKGQHPLDPRTATVLGSGVILLFTFALTLL